MMISTTRSTNRVCFTKFVFLVAVFLLLGSAIHAQTKAPLNEIHAAERMYHGHYLDYDSLKKATTRSLMAIAEKFQPPLPPKLKLASNDPRKIANVEVRRRWLYVNGLRDCAIVELGKHRTKEVPASFFIRLYRDDLYERTRDFAFLALRDGVHQHVYTRETEGIVPFLHQLSAGPKHNSSIELLGEFRDATAIPMISKYLSQEGVPNNRYELAHALYEIGTPEAKKALADNHIAYDALNPNDPEMKRQAAVIAESQTEPKQSFPLMTLVALGITVVAVITFIVVSGKRKAIKSR